MLKRTLIFAVAVLFLAGSVAFGQLVATGIMEGRVVDEQGAPLPGVSVEATSPRMVGSQSAVTDAEGKYRLFSLPSGTFTLVFSLPGFKTLRREGIVSQMNQTITLNITLQQAALEEEITVIGQSPLIDVKSTVKGQVLNKEVFMSLPRSRSFDGLLSTVPGVQSEGVAGGLSVDGATGTENMWYVDGTDVNQVHIGTRAQNVVMEIAEEVKITASGYNAEYGGSMGGVVNVITRSGGNAFHGDFIAYYEDNSMWMQGKSRDFVRWSPFDDEVYEYVNNDDLYFRGGIDRDPYKRIEMVFNLGGYILKDKLWFFGAVNPVVTNQQAERYFLSNEAPVEIAPDVFYTPARTYYDFYQKGWTYNAQFKLTAAPVRGMRLSASVVNNFYKYRGTIPSINGTSNAASDYYAPGYDYPDWSAAFQVDYSVGNNLLLSARAGYHYENTTNQQVANRRTTKYFPYSAYIYDDDPFFVDNPDLLHYSGWADYTGSFRVLQREKYGRISGNIDANYYVNLSGEHAWKAGFQWLRDTEDTADAPVSPNVYFYWGRAYDNPILPERVEGTYGYYYVRGGWNSPYGYIFDISRDSFAIYLQDSWTINRKLTINAGVRTESEYIPSFNPDLSVKPISFGFAEKLAPRLGVVYDVFGDSSLKVFGSFGIYYDVMKLYMAEGAYGGFKWKSDYYELNNPDWTAIANNNDPNDRANQERVELGNRYVGTIDWRIPSFDTTDPNLKPVSQREISFGAEKKLMEDLSLSVRLVNKHLINTIEDIGVATPAGEQYYNANPGGDYINAIYLENLGSDYPLSPKAKREYYGMNVSLEKRFRNNWQGGINYTLSSVKGNYGGLSSSDEEGRNSPNVERYYDLWFVMYDLSLNELSGPLPQDRTHYLKAYGSYTLPFGLTLGFTGYARSGLPKSSEIVINGIELYPNNRADWGRLPWTMWADLYAEFAIRIKQRYSMSINLQVNNVTNTKTIQNVDMRLNRQSMGVSDEDLLTGSFDWQAALDTPGDPYWKNIRYGEWTSRFGTWGARLGLRLSF
jgi:hypothetical protein